MATKRQKVQASNDVSTLTENGKMWDLTPLYSGIDDPAIELDVQRGERAAEEFAEKWQHRTTELSNATVLREAIDDWETLNRSDPADKADYYVTLYREINSNDDAAQALEARLQDRTSGISEKIAFFRLAVGAIDVSLQSALLNDPMLEPYREWLRRRFDAASHDVSVEVQTAFNRLLPQANTAWTNALEKKLGAASATLLIEGTPKKVPFHQLRSYLSSTDAEVAAAANMAHGRIARQNADLAAAELNAIVKSNIEVNRIRKYDRHEGASFLRNDLPATVVDSMLEMVERNYAVSHRFYAMKARLMGSETMDYSQRALPFGSLPSGFTFEQSADMLRNILGSLDPVFVEMFNRTLAAGRIDYLPRPGKGGGAACWAGTITLPSYMMLNFSGSLSDVETLAHEFGHFLNNIHMQNGGMCSSLTYHAPTSLAEVASTFFEKYILEAVLAKADDETRLAVLVSWIGGDIATIFRQTAATRFEQHLYESSARDGYVPAAQIGKILLKDLGGYLGPQVLFNKNAATDWVDWSHFRNGFYNYGYTFAQLVSMALQERVDADPAYINTFRKFLSVGASMGTQELLESLDLNVADGSVWMAGIKKMEERLDVAESLAVKLGKL